MSNLLFICGSLREQSSSKVLANTLIEKLNNVCDTSSADIGCLPHFNSDIVGDTNVTRFSKQIAAADGVVIVSPEYNYSVPGVLKNALDWASRPAMDSVFKGKPVFMITVSGGALGGVRAQSHLKYIFNGMLANVFATPEVVVAYSNTKVQDGVFTDVGTLDFATDSLRAFLKSLPLETV